MLLTKRLVLLLLLLLTLRLDASSLTREGHAAALDRQMELVIPDSIEISVGHPQPQNSPLTPLSPSLSISRSRDGQQDTHFCTAVRLTDPEPVFLSKSLANPTSSLTDMTQRS